MSLNRDAFQNVHFYNAATNAKIGGFFRHGSITEESLLCTLSDVLLVVEKGHSLRVQHRDSGQTITPSSNPVALGVYDIYSTGTY